MDCSYGNFTVIPDIPEIVTDLKLDHNRLTSIPRGAFSKLTKLEKLNLNYNAIRKIEPFAFEGLISLTKLDIRDNEIQTLCHNCFANIPKLQHIDLHHNLLNESTYDCFQGTAELISVNLCNNRFESIPTLGYQPNLEKIALASNLIKNATFPMSYRYCSKVLYINLAANARMLHLDNNTFRSLAGLIINEMTLAYNNINIVMPGTFEVFQSVKSLSLIDNPLSISSLKNVADGLSRKNVNRLDLSGVFGSDKKFQIGLPLFKFGTIQELLLDRNSISVLSNGTFEGMRSLLLLSLRNNELTTIAKSLPSQIEMLDLQGNKISVIYMNDTRHLFNLKRLYLSHNDIEWVRLRVFEGLGKLEILDLAKNKIGILPGDMFKSFQNLTYLDLSNNNLHTISLRKKHFENLVSLRHLDMSSNGCSDLSTDMFQPMISLKYLNLNGNELGDILAGDGGKNLFKGLNELEKLYIVDNNIRVLPDITFRDQISLKILKVGENRLSGWGPNLFKFTKDLQVLDMYHNQIGVLREENLHHLRNLTILNLKDNPFACGCDLRWFRNWIKTTKVKLTKLEAYKCKSPPKWRDKPLLEFTEDKIQCEFHSNSIYIIAGSVPATLFCTFVLGLLVYRNRWRLRLRFYLLSKRGKKFLGNMRAHAQQANYGAINDQDLYDAYISCSDQDYDWVLHHLLPGIDYGRYDDDNVFGGDFKLYYDPRDQQPGNKFLRGDFKL